MIWLLIAAMTMTASISNAAWQCLDGHPCPPGCAMTRGNVSLSGAAPACCQPGKQHCPLCPSGPQLQRNPHGAACTSSVCVLRLRAHPDALTAVAFAFALEMPAITPVPLAFAPVMQTARLTYAEAPRGPPRAACQRLYAPRAPPILL